MLAIPILVRPPVRLSGHRRYGLGPAVESPWRTWKHVSSGRGPRERTIAVQTAKDIRETMDLKRRYDALVQRNLAGIYRTSLDGTLLEANDALAHILGYRDAAEIGRAHV